MPYLRPGAARADMQTLHAGKPAVGGTKVIATSGCTSARMP